METKENIGAMKPKLAEENDPFYQLVPIAPSNDIINFKATIDPRYKKVTGVYFISTANLMDNINYKLTRPLMIANEEIYPIDFPTGLLYPRNDYQPFTKILGEGAGSDITAQWQGDGNAVTVKIKLEK